MNKLMQFRTRRQVANPARASGLGFLDSMVVRPFRILNRKNKAPLLIPSEGKFLVLYSDDPRRR